MKDRLNWEIFCFGRVSAAADVNSDSCDDSEHSEEDSVDEGECQNSTNDLSIRKDLLFQQLDCESKGTFFDFKNATKMSPTNLINAEIRLSVQSGSLDNRHADGAPKLVAVSPNISLLLQFDQVLSQLLLSYHVEWLEASK